MDFCEHPYEFVDQNRLLKQPQIMPEYCFVKLDQSILAQLGKLIRTARSTHHKMLDFIMNNGAHHQIERADLLNHLDVAQMAFDFVDSLLQSTKSHTASTSFGKQDNEFLLL